MHFSAVNNLTKGTWNSVRRSICKECEIRKMFRSVKAVNTPKTAKYHMPKIENNEDFNEPATSKMAKPLKTKRSMSLQQPCKIAFNPTFMEYGKHEINYSNSISKNTRRRKTRPKIMPWKPPKRHDLLRRVCLAHKYSVDHMPEKDIQLEFKLMRQKNLRNKLKNLPYNPWKCSITQKNENESKDGNKRKYSLTMQKLMPWKSPKRQNQSQKCSQDEKYKNSYFDIAPENDKKHIDKLLSWNPKKPHYQPWDFNIDKKNKRNFSKDKNKVDHQHNYTLTKPMPWKPPSKASLTQYSPWNFNIDRKYKRNGCELANKDDYQHNSTKTKDMSWKPSSHNRLDQYPPWNFNIDRKYTRNGDLAHKDDHQHNYTETKQMSWKPSINIQNYQKNSNSCDCLPKNESKNKNRSANIPKILPWKLTKSHSMPIKTRKSPIGPFVLRPIAPGKPISDDLIHRRTALYKQHSRLSGYITTAQQINQNMKIREEWRKLKKAKKLT